MTRVIRCDDDGDGRSDREVTVPMPIFHVLGLLSDLGDRYWVLPDRTAGGHMVSGFASRDDRGVVRVLLYAHDARDTQSRSGATFDVALELAGLARIESRVGAGVSLRPRPQLAVPAGAGAAGPAGRRAVRIRRARRRRCGTSRAATVGPAAGDWRRWRSSDPRPCRRPRRP